MNGDETSMLVAAVILKIESYSPEYVEPEALPGSLRSQETIDVMVAALASIRSERKCAFNDLAEVSIATIIRDMRDYNAKILKGLA